MVGPDTIAKFLFTSGSTGTPKAVINTQRMWCSNQEMRRTMSPIFQDEPPVLVEWAPWHHTAGGNNDFGIVLYNGGSYYIDEGKPLPGAIETTVRNLREIAPTWYFNVPKGYERCSLPQDDARLRQNFFSRLKVLWFAAARTCRSTYSTSTTSWPTAPAASDAVPDRARRHRDRAATRWGACGRPTTRATWACRRPACEVKLVPIEGKFEMRVKGPDVTPGYWRQPELTARGLRRGGLLQARRSVRFVDDRRPEAGLLFRGRIAEDFKLTSGTWVNVGPLRARFLEHFAPLARDVVITGEGRDEVGALIFLPPEPERRPSSAVSNA